jgi:hypothetical protein
MGILPRNRKRFATPRRVRAWRFNPGFVCETIASILLRCGAKRSSPYEAVPAVTVP